MTATILEAKTRLSELIKRAEAGEEVIITSGRQKRPVVRMVPVESPAKRRLGFCLNPDFVLPDDFFDPLPEEELRLWEGEGR